MSPGVASSVSFQCCAYWIISVWILLFLLFGFVLVYFVFMFVVRFVINLSVKDSQILSTRHAAVKWAGKVELFVLRVLHGNSSSQSGRWHLRHDILV